MTSPKTEARTTGTKSKDEAQRPRELELAREVHTLAQLVYGEIVRAHPWVHPIFPLAGFEYPPAWGFTEASGGTPAWAAPGLVP